MASDHEHCHTPRKNTRKQMMQERKEREGPARLPLLFYVALATLYHDLVYLPHWLHLSTCRVRHGAAGGWCAEVHVVRRRSNARLCTRG